VEGGHHCEAACRILQGYQLGADIPLDFDAQVELPESSILIKPIQTNVYYSQNDGIIINNDVLKHFRDITSSIADHKELYVGQTWHNFFDNVLNDIYNHGKLLKELFKTQKEFYLEESTYQNISKPSVTKSARIKLLLHEILTKAIFHYKPCSDLKDSNRSKEPNEKEWGQDSKTGKWLALSVEPYQHVSELNLKLFNIYFFLT